MSSLKQRFLSGLLTFVMVFTFTLSVSAASFTDVKQGDWYYETITEMTEKGLFNGKGNNLFCPDDTMTKAEFITVVMRILYPDTDFTSMEGQPWWQSAYDMALAGLITQSEFPVSEIEQTISRQEMALVSSKALMMRGETFFITEDLHKKIPDYNQVGKEYTMYVEMAYSMGILCGVDDKGTFSPLQTLTRAEAATVLYRIENKDARVKPAYKPASSGSTVVDVNAPITITEGAERTNRLAREGDTVIKADGSSVVLKKGPNGVLGEGQGVAPDLGFYYNVAGDNPSRVEDGKKFMGGSREGWTNSLGSYVVSDFYYVHPLTGEGHWGNEWSVIAGASYDKLTDAGIVGKYEGEVSADKQSVWDATIEDWIPLYCNPQYVK